MIGGLLIDLLVLGAVAAFAWGASQLGGVSALARLAEAIAAFTVAALLRDPAGNIVEGILGTSEDFSRLVGMGIVGLATWIAANRLFSWWRSTRTVQPIADDEGFAEPEYDPLDTIPAARIAGAVLGLGWAVLFVALLVLQPSSTPWSRAAIDSRVGGMVIAQESMLRWLNEGFPHYTQALPKGKLGALTGEQSDLPMHEPVESKERGRDPDQLLRSINDLRRDGRARVLAFNPDIAAVARRHAIGLAQEQQLSYRSPGGSELDTRVRAALGDAAGDFGDDVGIEVAWAHDPATAYRGLLDSTRAQSLIRDGRWTEIGIGVADAGWFNGRIYVLLLVGTESPAEAAEETGETADPADAAGIAPSDPNLTDDPSAGTIEDVCAAPADANALDDPCADQLE